MKITKNSMCKITVYVVLLLQIQHPLLSISGEIKTRLTRVRVSIKSSQGGNKKKEKCRTNTALGYLEPWYEL